MRTSSLTLAALLLWAVPGCGGGEEAGTPADGEPADTTTVAPPPPTTTEPAPPPPVEQAPVTVANRSSNVAYDEPWTPEHTGTVDPGMSYDDVVAVWGEPVTDRMADGRRYLYFRNGCEASCGTFDVVFLEGGQVVDAIVRGSGHTYSGTSSSPSGVEPMATLPAAAGS